MDSWKLVDSHPSRHGQLILHQFCLFHKALVKCGYHGCMGRHSNSGLLNIVEIDRPQSYVLLISCVL